MIVKNEAHQLRRCLTSVQPWVDEIIIVDTGSEDQTVAIAREFTPHVYHFQWQQDFAAARTYSLQWATGEWIFYIDADEELVVTDPQWRSQLLDSPFNCLSLLRQEVDARHNWSDFATLRFARNYPGLRFVGALHEQFCLPGNTPRKVGELKGLHLVHHNQQTQEQFLKKIRERNIPILQQMVQRGDRRLMTLVCLGDHYAVCGETAQSLYWYHQALDSIAADISQQQLPQDTTWLRSLLFWASCTAFNAKDYDSVQCYASYGLRYFPAYPPLLYVAGLIIFELGLPRGALPYFHRCLDLFSSGTYDRSEPFDRQWMTTQPAYSLGFTYLTLKEYKSAIAYFQKTLEFNPHYQPAQHHLQQLLLATAASG